MIILTPYWKDIFPDYARVELNLRKEDILKPIAREKQIRKPESVYQNSGKQTPVHVDKEIAKQSKVSHDTVHKVKFIRDNADEETKASIDDKIPTEESYEAIVKLWKMECQGIQPQSPEGKNWCNQIGMKVMKRLLGCIR